MSKLRFNYNEMSKIIPDLKDIISDLKNIAGQIDDMSLPIFFSESRVLNSIKGDLKDSAKDVDDLLDKLNKSNRILDNFIENFSNEAKRLPNYVIDKRDSIIKL